MKWLKDMLQRLKEDLSNVHKSWTIWFNAAMGFIAFALPQLAAFLPQLQPYLPEADYNHLMIATLVGNFILRFKTASALRAK